MQGPSPLSGFAERRAAPRQHGAPPVVSLPEGPGVPPGFKLAQPPFGKTISRSSPRTRGSASFIPEYPGQSADRPYPTVASRMSAAATLPHAFRSQAPVAANLARSRSNPSSVGSFDMTGVGSGRRVSVSPESPGTPDVLYVADGRAANANTSVSPSAAGEYHPFTGTPNAEPPHAAFVESPRTRRASLESRMAMVEQRPSLRPNITRSSTLPLAANMTTSTSGAGAGAAKTNANGSGSGPQIQVHAPSPVVAQATTITNGEAGQSGAGGTRAVHEGDTTANTSTSTGRSTHAKGLSLAPLSVPPLGRRTPTPPLLTPGTFRDSAFSSVTGKSAQEVPGAWVAREFEAAAASEPGVASRHPHAHIHQAQLHAGALDAGYPRSAGAAGEHAGWERGDVGQGHRALPPTIREQPSKEGEEMTVNMNMTTQPSRRAQRTEPIRERDEVRAEGARREGEHGAGREPEQRRAQEPRREEPSSRGRSTRPANGTAPPEKDKRPTSGRRETAMSGWVLVNVEGATPVSEKPGAGRPGAHTKAASQSPPGSGKGARPHAPRHQRSHSDSHLMRSSGGRSRTPQAAAPATATMSAAAKTIAMIDAIDSTLR